MAAAPKNPLPNTGPYTPPAAVPAGAYGHPGGAVLPADVAYSTPGDRASLVDLLGWLYPPHQPGGIGTGWSGRNSLPVADRQTLTMNAVRPSGDPQHPLPGTGPYRPPQTVSPNQPQQPLDEFGLAAATMAPAGIAHLLATLLHLYPGGRAWGVSGEGAQTIQNSQAIGDRSPTTMTNPLPNYTPPAMVNTPLSAQLRAMINHALAARGLHPLINAPLPVGPTQMGAR